MANTLNTVSSGGIEDGSIVNADINASAAIALSKLASTPAVLTGSTNNTITTVTGANAIQGEANLIFNGSKLVATGDIECSTGYYQTNSSTERFSLTHDGANCYLENQIGSFYVKSVDNANTLEVSNGAVTLNSANLVIGTDGKGIDFSATGGPSSGSSSSELFDDYEQGTFTPGIGGTSGNPTYTASTESGKYIKIGNQVHVELLIVITNVAAQGSGNWKITNMPYTFGGDSYASVGIIGYNDIFATEVNKVYISGSHLTVIPDGVTQSNQTFAQNAFSTGYFSVTIDYISS